MSTTKDTLRNWFDKGKAENATHMIVICDTYDYEDFPVYVGAEESAKERYAEESKKSMQKVMEVYNLSIDREMQMSEHRAFNF